MEAKNIMGERGQTDQQPPSREALRFARQQKREYLKVDSISIPAHCLSLSPWADITKNPRLC